MSIEHLTLDTFKEKIFDFEANKEWSYKGSSPAIIDFYADWCGPCKMVAPILEEINTEYGETLTVYKVDTEQQQDLASMFGISSIPSILFIPTGAQPQMAMGALPKKNIEDIIKDLFGLENPAS